jgi:tetratricopeptide (TPR) repeat protein
MSPEQFHVARQKDVGPASDVYSLGVVLFEILDGSRPFDGTAIELREKHLKMEPPELKGDLEKWSRIVQHCLAKKPENRYPDIERLISDTDRAVQGVSLSVDVSCPKCRHINTDPAHDICEKCGVRLPDTLFHECPRCAKRLRLDTEICPGCGSHVMAHYVLKDRWDRLQKLKDEDPVAALELLEVMLRDGAGEHDRDALELVKDLRKKQSQISGLIADADQAAAEGELEKAVKAWRAVLKVIPRHQTAQEHVENLESTLQAFAEHWGTANDLMDQGQFERADSQLQKCLELIPKRAKARSELNVCRQRAQEHTTALRQARECARQKLLLRARQYAQAALEQAAKSAEAKALVDELTSTLKKTKGLADQVRQQIPRAEFAQAREAIDGILRLQADGEGVPVLQANLDRVQNTYLASMKNAQTARTDCHLDKAADAVESALTLCPESAEAKSLLEEIGIDQEKALALLKEAKSLIRAAKFAEADTLLERVEGLWPTVEGLDEARELSIVNRVEYHDRLQRSQQAKARRALDEALREAQLACAVCPQSSEAKTLLKALQDSQSWVHALLAEAVSSTKAARFDEANAKLLQVEDLWINGDGLAEAREELVRSREAFHREMRIAEQAKGEKDLEKALGAVMVAISVCPESPKALGFAEAIKNDQAIAKDHIKKAKKAREATHFKEARDEIGQAKKIWPTVPGLREAIAELRQAEKGRRRRRIKWSIAVVVVLVSVYGILRVWLTYANRRYADAALQFARKGAYAAAQMEYDKCFEIPLLVSRPKVPTALIEGMEAERRRRQDYEEAVRLCRDLMGTSVIDGARSAAQKALSLANTTQEEQDANTMMTAIAELEVTKRHDDWVRQAQGENNVDRKIDLLRNALKVKEVASTRHLLEETLGREAVSLVRQAAGENDANRKIELLQKALTYENTTHTRREIESAIRFSRPEQTAVGVVRWYTDWEWIIEKRTEKDYTYFMDPVTKKMMRISHIDGEIAIKFTDDNNNNPTVYGTCHVRALDKFVPNYGSAPYRKVLNWSIQGNKHLMLYSLDRADNEDAFFWSKDDPSLVIQVGDIRYGDLIRKGYPELRFAQNPKYRVGRR